ncbi:hypothetical protein V5O48_012914 [Marasmius crinis-equi]|uniref:Nephrocystin 3-like N-terminal domain-containing protein n=1 Tax=Marasmius crinis-equi TaxID=585013 RepID=A0ABR3F1I9_9AGAR
MPFTDMSTRSERGHRWNRIGSLKDKSVRMFRRLKGNVLFTTTQTTISASQTTTPASAMNAGPQPSPLPRTPRALPCPPHQQSSLMDGGGVELHAASQGNAMQVFDSASGTQNIHTTIDRQHNYAGPYQNLSFGGDQFINTGSGNVVQNNIGTETASRTNLWNAISGVGFSHRAEQQFTRGGCLEGTREMTLKFIHEWSVAEGQSFPICWLSGAAGTGKTAIAMTVAESYENEGLVSSFFFFRSDPKRNNPSALMLTIAYGLTVTNSLLRNVIEREIANNPEILEAKLEDQFRELVLKPSATMHQLRSREINPPASKDPNLVIIDGLDECGDEETQLRVLHIILSSYQQIPRSPLKFLVCSRPESWIREAFDAEPLHDITQRVILDETFEPSKDIERYYVHEFTNIRNNPKYARLHFPDPWPSTADFWWLLKRTDRQFVYAATVAKFVRLPYSNPIDQLRIILTYSPESESSKSSLHELDCLYHIVLSVNPNHEKLIPILAAIFILPPFGRASPDFIEVLLGLSTGEVNLTLRAMHSVLDIGDGDKDIRVFHTSFSDFIADRSRSGQFHVDKQTQRHFLARQWIQALIRHVKDAPDDVLDSEHRPKPLKILVQGWIVFCFQDPVPSMGVLLELDNLLRSIFSTFSDQRSRAHISEKLLSIVAAIFIVPPYAPPSLEFIESLLGPFTAEIDRILRAMLSMSVFEGQGRRDSIHPFNTGLLAGFFFDRARSGDLFINKLVFRYSLARRWLRTLSAENIQNLKQLYKSNTSLLLTGWIDFCASLPKATQGLLYDLWNVDVNALFLSELPPPHPLPPWPVRRAEVAWDRTFNPLLSWIKGGNNVDPLLIKRYEKSPECFHLELAPGLSVQDDVVHWAILNTTGCILETSMTLRVDEAPNRYHRPPLPLRLTECNCPATSGYPKPDENGHRIYRAACLETARAFVSDFVSREDTAVLELNGIFGNMLDSSLLQHCDFEPELLSLCATFFSSARKRLSLKMTPDERKQRRAKVLAWLETCPSDYARDVESLKTQVMALLLPGREFYSNLFIGRHSRLS